MITGEDSSAEIQYDLYVGYSGSANYFELSEGATFIATREFGMGQNVNASYNTGLVTGADSKLTAAGGRQFYIGRAASSHNRLTVSEGGEILSGHHLYVGAGGATGNVLRVLSGGHAESHTNLYVGAGTGAASNALNLADGTVTVGEHLFVGTSAFAADNLVAVTNGGGMQVEGVIQLGGNSSGSGNSMLIEGAGSWVTNVGRTIISHGTNNQLTVRDGGRFASLADYVFIGQSGSVGALGMVEGTGSVLYASGIVDVGQSSVGSSLVVTNGGNVDVNRLRSITWGAGTDRDAFIHVSGEGSTVTARNMVAVGMYNSENHLLRVDDGARVTTGTGDDNIGGWWDNTSSNKLQVADSGSAYFSGGNLCMGIGEGDTHHGVEVLDGGLLSVAGQLRVGEAGSWNLVEISGEGMLESSSAVIGDTMTADNNRVLIAGAGTTWTNTGTIYVSAGEGEGNRLEIRDGAIVDSGDTVVGAGGTLLLDNGDLVGTLEIDDGGALEGDGTINGFSVINAGRIAPGQSAGELEIMGNLTLLETSVLEMEIGGTGDGEYDRLSSLNFTIAFDGTLSLALIGGYEPQEGHTFTLFQDWDLANSSGSFADYDLPDLGAGLGWDRSGLESTGTLTVIPEPSSTILLGGLALLAVLRRRKNET